jgi:streptogramin lyase
MTLYRGTEYPFVHALSSKEAWAICIDLPTRGFDDVEAAADWGIVGLGAGKSDLAVNATLGIAVEINADLSVKRTVDFEPSAAAAFRLAKFGHGELGPAGRRVIAAPDGASVFAAGEGGIVRLGATDLGVQQRYLRGTAIDGLTLTPDGTTLFALTRTGGRIARLDVATGEVERWVGDGGFDRLLGALPW